MTVVVYDIFSAVSAQAIAATIVFPFLPIFDRVCGNNGVEHRLAKANYPWGDGQVERMRRAIKKVAVKRDVYFSHGQLITSMYGFRMTCNFAKLLKILNGLYAL